MTPLSIAFAALFGLLALTLAAIVTLAQRERRGRERARLRHWARGLMLQTLAWPLFALALFAPSAPAVALGSALLLCGYIELARALERMLGVRPSPPVGWVFGPLLAGLLWLLPALGAPPSAGVTVFWGVAFAVTLWFAARLQPRLAPPYSGTDLATLGVFALGGAVVAVRLLDQLATPYDGPSVDALSATQGLALAYFLIAPVLASVGFLLMHHERQRRRLEQAASTDPLTGAYNRRGFLRHARRVMQRARFDRTPAALMLIDIDRFKSINDAHGHGAGDAVLVAVARAIDGIVRPSDLLARHGGDEFILLCAADDAQAQAIAERIGRQVRSQPVAWRGGRVQATVSIGIAQTRHADEETLEDLLARADRQLYAAKRAGRDRSAGLAGTARVSCEADV